MVVQLVKWTEKWISDPTLSCEYRVVRNRYSWLLFNSEDGLCTNLCLQEQSMNMASKCQCLAFASRHSSIVRTSQCSVRKDHPYQQWRNDRSMIVCSETVCFRHKIACKKLNNTFDTMNHDFLVTRELICQWFSLVTSSLVKIIGKSPHSSPKNRHS